MPFTNAQREWIIVTAGELGLQGAGGGCFRAAVAINRLLFNGRGRYTAVFNRHLLARGHWVGHVGVEYRGRIWDSQYVYDNRREFIGEWSVVEGHGLTTRQSHEAVVRHPPERVLLRAGVCGPIDPFRAIQAAIARLPRRTVRS